MHEALPSLHWIGSLPSNLEYLESAMAQLHVLWLLSLFHWCQAEKGECRSSAEVLDPEALSSYAWYGLANNESVAFYRCLHDVTSLQTMLSALYFGAAKEAPQSTSLKEAPGLGSIWLNPEVDTHHLWYAHGPEEDQQYHVEVKGMSLKVENFPHADSCDLSTEAVCYVLEVEASDTSCIASKDEGCKIQIVEKMQKLKEAQRAADPNLEEAGLEAAYCSLAAVASDSQDARSSMEWFRGYASAQCLLTSCGGETDTLIDYEALFSCRLDGNVPLTTTVCLLLLFYYFILMGVVADGYLVPVLIQIGRTLKMSDALLGATLLALGGSANDFMTGFVSALATDGNGSSDSDVRLWLGGVFGTGVFINTFVASLVLLFAGPGGIQVDSAVLSRDISFRFLAVGLMMLFGWLGFVSVYMAVFMNLLYIFYVVLSLRESQKLQSGEQAPNESRSSFTERTGSMLSFTGRGSRVAASFQALAGQHVEEHASFTGDSCNDRLKRHAGWQEEAGIVERLSFVLALPLRPFLVLTMATTTWDGLVNVLLPLGMCIFVPFGNPFGNLYTQAFQDDGSSSPWPSRITLMFFWLAGLALSLSTWATSRNLPPRQYVAPMAFSWATFLTSLLWVALFANEVVGAMQLLGIIMGLKPMAMGITLLAWGNCVDNVFGLLGLAKAGEFRVAITGIYAGPMFNVLFGNGSILLMSGLLNGGRTAFMMTPCAFVLLGSLEVILVATLLYSKFAGWRMTRPLGICLGIAYFVVLIMGFTIEHFITSHETGDGKDGKSAARLVWL